jgi:hypothetical protein
MGAGPQTGGVADVYCNVQYPLMSMPCQELHSDKRIFLVLRALGAVMLQSKRHSVTTHFAEVPGLGLTLYLSLTPRTAVGVRFARPGGRWAPHTHAG